MANTSSFGFTNVTPSTNVVTPVAINGTDASQSNYGKVKDEPNLIVTSNKTCPLDLQEKVTTRYQPLTKVSSSLTIQNPAPVRSGCQYVIKEEAVLRTTDTDGKIVYDEPVVAYLTIKHLTSGTITVEAVDTIVKRLLGACYNPETGAPLWGDYMRDYLQPYQD